MLEFCVLCFCVELFIGKSVLQPGTALVLDFAVRIREKGLFACLFEVTLNICSTFFT